MSLNESSMPENQWGPSRSISLQVPFETLPRDLQNFKQKALELGASLAEGIPADWGELDERVRPKSLRVLTTAKESGDDLTELP
jgi:hypothetical protein